ncbi:uncharacterized protein LOC115667209 [Syzygium oleosum]|uniref:uncharacterized protein LOC115667209 n=1 Tax=Syzygium oleosum TaxID=219896 RepID=UPI0024B99C80|nr:uncharacterized protein LOC115667209 [Syzygium oleosum]
MEDLREMQRTEQEQEPEPEQEQESRSGPPHMTPLKPLTHDAYGGGMYGTDDRQGQQQQERPPASDTQSADGPVGPPVQPKHRPPPSTGDRDLDITGQSYIQ